MTFKCKHKKKNPGSTTLFNLETTTQPQHNPSRTSEEEQKKKLSKKPEKTSRNMSKTQIRKKKKKELKYEQPKSKPTD